MAAQTGAGKAKAKAGAKSAQDRSKTPPGRAKPRSGAMELKGVTDGDDAKKTKGTNLQGEHKNIFILMVLYTLQGIPMGLGACLPLILKSRGASFTDMGTFSLNQWPFSVKLAWAPIVDALYVRAFGRRKTWMVPAQLLIGATLLFTSFNLDALLNREPLDIKSLTAIFFFLHFLCATQDIAVDGWAITMLREENVGYASTCNVAGQTLGYFLAFTGFMTLEHFGLVTLPGFCMFWGLVFIVVTLGVAVMKKEDQCRPEEEPPSVLEAYRQMLSMATCVPIRHLAILLLIWKLPFAPADAIAGLKIQEYGVPKEHMAYFATTVMPLQILMPLIISKKTASNTPMDIAIQVYPVRSLLTLAAAVVVSFTPSDMSSIPWGFYFFILVLTVVQTICASGMFAAQMAFFARLTKTMQNIGGTYMTMLNTIANLGGMWTITATYYLIDMVGCKGEDCTFERDGYYFVSVVSTLFGLSFTLFGVPLLDRLQKRHLDDWKVE